MLERLWPYGFSSIGEVNFDTAGYVARYAMKKVKGEAARAHYGKKVPEYLTMSRRPGIGRGWLERHLTDVYPSDQMVVNGVVTRPPRYYDDLLGKHAPGMLAGIKLKRIEKADKEANLVVKEVIKEASIATLTRIYEE